MQRLMLKGLSDTGERTEEKAALATATTVVSCALHAFMLFINGLYLAIIRPEHGAARGLCSPEGSWWLAETGTALRDPQ